MKKIKKHLYIIVICFYFTNIINASPSDHQRIATERSVPLQIRPSIAISFFDIDTKEHDTLFLREIVSVDIQYKNTWIFFMSIPFVQNPYLDMVKVGTMPSAVGDLNLGSGYTFRKNNLQNELSVQWEFPTGLWYPYEIEKKHIKTGEGFHRITVSFNTTQFIDPLAIMLGVTMSSTLPRKEPYTVEQEPFSISIPLSCIFAINSVIAFQTQLIPEMNMPTISNGSPTSTTIYRSLIGINSIVFSKETYSLGFQISKDLSILYSNPSLSFFYSYNFFWEKVHEEK